MNFETIQERNEYIVSQKDKGLTNHQISVNVGLTIRRVQGIYKTAKEQGLYRRKKGSGRPTILKPNDKQRITKLIKKDPYQSCVSIQRTLNLDVSHDTIYRYIRKTGLTHKKATRIPKLSKQDNFSRLSWASKFEHRDWNKIVFSDETAFSLNQSCYGWSKKGSRITQKNQCYNKKIHVWGSMCRNGPISFRVFERTMTSDTYVSIIEDSFLPNVQKVIGSRWYLQQDNARAHTASNTTQFFKRERIRIINWPARSPDLNPIGNLWAILKRAVYSRSPSKIEDLKNYVQQEISKIDRI